MRWREWFATSFASLMHQSKFAKASGTRSHGTADCDWRSTKHSPGELMHSSVTSGSARIGRRLRSVSSSAEARGIWGRAAAMLTAGAFMRHSLAFSTYTDRKSTSRATRIWMRSPWFLTTVGGMLIVLRSTSVITSRAVPVL